MGAAGKGRAARVQPRSHRAVGARHALLRWTAGFVVAAVGITGCLPGGGKTDARPKGPFAGLSGGQILDRAATATTDAPSVRMSGQMPDEATGGTARFDMVLSGKGECSGTISYAQGRRDPDRGTLYVRYDEQFFLSAGGTAQETDAAVELLAGKWVKTLDEDPDVQEVAHFCELEKLLGDRHVRSTRRFSAMSSSMRSTKSQWPSCSTCRPR